MKAEKTIIPDVLLLLPKVFEDERGFFMETYQAAKFAELGIRNNFVQDNHSRSRQGVLRGLHYQIRHPQGKLVRAISGEIFDVAVDIRRSSPGFGKWTGVILSSDNKQQLWVPPGFAHGYYVISEWAEIVYKTTDYYAPEWERTILWNDSDLGIKWPLLHDRPLHLSQKDQDGLSFSQAEVFEENV
jgi:dTDP-4-dehydrorhamnose 3,5-epimerase